MDSLILKSYIRKILKESISPEQSEPIIDKYNSIYSGMLKGNKKKLMKYVDPKFKRPNPDAMAMGRAINLVKKDSDKESVNEATKYSLDRYKKEVAKLFNNKKNIDDQQVYDDMITAFLDGVSPAEFVSTIKEGRRLTKYFDKRDKAEKFYSNSDSLDLGYIGGGKSQSLIGADGKIKKESVNEVDRYSGFNRNPEDPDSVPFEPKGSVAQFREDLRALFGKFKGDLKNPEFIKGVAEIMVNWKSLLRSQLDEAKYRVEYTTQDGEKAKSRVYNSEESVNESLKLGVKYELPTGETGFIMTGGSKDPKDWKFSANKESYLSVKDKLKPTSKQPGKYDGAFDMGHGKGHHIDEESINEYTNPGYQIETKYYDPNEIKEVADRLQELTGIENIQYEEHKWADGTGSLRFKISESYRGTSKEYYIGISHTYDGKWKVEVGSSYGAGASYVSMGKDTLNIDMEGFNNMKDINRETFSEVWDKILQAAPPVFKSRRKELEDHHKSEVKSWSDFYGKRGRTSGTIDERLTSMVREVYSEKQRKWACAQDDPKFDEMCKDTAISKKKLNEETDELKKLELDLYNMIQSKTKDSQIVSMYAKYKRKGGKKELGNIAQGLKEEMTSTVSKARAKSELKQMLQGYRDDGMGKSTLKAVLAIDKDGKETKVKKLEDFSKFEKGTKFALKETTMEKDRLTELIKTALKGPIKEGYYGTSNIENITSALGYGDLNDFFNDNPGAIETLTSWIEDIPEFREKLEDEFSNQELEELGFYDLDGYDSDESKFKEAGETSGFDMRGIDEDKDWIQKAIKRPSKKSYK